MLIIVKHHDSCFLIDIWDLKIDKVYDLSPFIPRFDRRLKYRLLYFSEWKHD